MLGKSIYPGMFVVHSATQALETANSWYGNNHYTLPTFRGYSYPAVLTCDDSRVLHVNVMCVREYKEMMQGILNNLDEDLASNAVSPAPDSEDDNGCL